MVGQAAGEQAQDLDLTVGELGKALEAGAFPRGGSVSCFRIRSATPVPKTAWPAATDRNAWPISWRWLL